MPGFFDTTLNDEYVAVVEQCGFEIGELEELALNAVRYSLLPDEEKETVLAEFIEAYESLRAEHITAEAT